MLWLAFRAGFNTSGEGYNGEYGGTDAPQSPAGDDAALRSAFTAWARDEVGAR